MLVTIQSFTTPCLDPLLPCFLIPWCTCTTSSIETAFAFPHSSHSYGATGRVEASLRKIAGRQESPLVHSGVGGGEGGRPPLYSHIAATVEVGITLHHPLRPGRRRRHLLSADISSTNWENAATTSAQMASVFFTPSCTSPREAATRDLQHRRGSLILRIDAVSIEETFSFSFLVELPSISSKLMLIWYHNK